MTQKQLAEFHPFDETVDIWIQKHCQRDLNDILTILCGLVKTAEMPPETRELLLNGLAHLSCHIKSEMNELTTEVEGRVN